VALKNSPNYGKVGQIMADAAHPVETGRTGPPPTPESAPAASGDFSFAQGVHADAITEFFTAVYRDHNWSVNNSSLRDYSRRANMNGRIDGLIRMIEGRLGEGEDNVGLDLAAGSRPHALSNLLESGVLARALATNYADRRPRSLKRDPRLDHRKGNLLNPKTWQGIQAWQQQHAPEGFALAMHRPVGGLQDLPPDFYEGAAHAVLDMVGEDGMFFTQVPRILAAVPRHLERVCEGIQDRPDVEEVVRSLPRSKDMPVDERDPCVVIFKR
jgi:hypothetical protein